MGDELVHIRWTIVRHKEFQIQDTYSADIDGSSVTKPGANVGDKVGDKLGE